MRRRIRKAGPLKAAALLAAALLLVLLVVSIHLRVEIEQDERVRVADQLEPYSAGLASAIDRPMSMLAALHDFVMLDLPEDVSADRFAIYASGLSARTTGIRAIQLAPNGVVTFVYPVEGNVVGNDLLADERPEVKADVQRTLASDGTVLSGPYELRQGGLGLVGRRAVRTPDGDFWGFAIVVLDVPPLLESAGLAEAPPGLRYAVRDHEGRVFAGDESVFTESPVIAKTALVDGEWEIAAVPEGGWAEVHREDQVLVWGLGSVAVIAVSLMLYLVLAHERSLQAEVDEKTQVNLRLEEANQQLTEATAAKSRFLARMSHELRTPLNSIIGFSHLMSRGLAGTLNEEQTRHNEIINQSGKHLLALINDVLDLAKVEAGAVELRWLSVRPETALREVADALRPLADARGLALDIVPSEDMPTITTDPDKLRQILLNLAGNAVKFTDVGTVRLRLLRDAQRIGFAVTDTGPGIPNDRIESLFEPFAQMDRSDRLPQGTGLGLAISREYASMLGGQIEVESALGDGSTFTLWLPLDA